MAWAALGAGVFMFSEMRASLIIVGTIPTGGEDATRRTPRRDQGNPANTKRWMLLKANRFGDPDGIFG
jgi:hypothetical protein